MLLTHFTFSFENPKSRHPFKSLPSSHRASYGMNLAPSDFHNVECIYPTKQNLVISDSIRYPMGANFRIGG